MIHIAGGEVNIVDPRVKKCQCELLKLSKQFQAVGIEDATMRVAELDSAVILADMLWQSTVATGGMPFDTSQMRGIMMPAIKKTVADTSVFSFVIAYDKQNKTLIFGTEPMRIWTEEQIIRLTFPAYAMPDVADIFSQARSEVALAVTIRYALKHPNQRVALVYGQNHIQDWEAIYKKFGLVPKILNLPECYMPRTR
jgi:hypothetical protein